MNQRRAPPRRYGLPPPTNYAALTVTILFSIAVVIGFMIDSRRCHELVVWSSNEKFALLTSIATAYNHEVRPVDRRCVRVIVENVPSGDAEDALAREARIGGSLPQVWSPQSKTWGLLLDQHRKSLGRSAIVPALPQSLIQSPLVIAMPQKLADTFKACRTEIRWRDILDLAQDPDRCARYTELWGRLRLAKTNPTISTSGLHALISTYSAAVRSTGQLSLEEVARSDVQNFVRGVELSVVHYGESISEFLATLYAEDERRAALSYVSAIAVEEKQVFEYNRGNPKSQSCTPCPKPPPFDRLVALYPADGTLIADHPYMVLNADWVSDAHRTAARDFLEHLESRPIQERFLKDGFRDHLGFGDPEVLQSPYFDLNEPHAKVALSPAPVLVKMLASWSELRKRANILLVLDVGESMGSGIPGRGVTKLELAKGAISAAMPRLAPDDAVGLWTFARRPGEPYHGLTQIGSGAAIARDVASLQPGAGERHLYATVRAGVDHLRSQFARDRINAIVVLSDGDDVRSGSSDLYKLLDHLRDQPEDERVRVFTIAYSRSARADLTQIAEASKGRFYDATDPLDINGILRDVISNF